MHCWAFVVGPSSLVTAGRGRSGGTDNCCTCVCLRAGRRARREHAFARSRRARMRAHDQAVGGTKTLAWRCVVRCRPNNLPHDPRSRCGARPWRSFFRCHCIRPVGILALHSRRARWASAPPLPAHLVRRPAHRSAAGCRRAATPLHMRRDELCQQRVQRWTGLPQFVVDDVQTVRVPVDPVDLARDHRGVV